MHRVANPARLRFLSPMAALSSQVRQSEAAATGSRYLRCVYAVLSLVLLVAAAAKVLFPAPTGTWVFRNKYFFVAIVLGEVAAAGWLLFLPSVLPRTTRWFVTILFGTLGAYSLTSWLAGYSCQCFGAGEIQPIWTAMFDLAAVGSVWSYLDLRKAFTWCSCGRWDLRAMQRRRLRALVALPVNGVVLLVLGIGGCMAMWWAYAGPAGMRDFQPGRIHATVLHPEEWVGNPLKLRWEADRHLDLNQGTWCVVIHRPNCMHCREVIGRVIDAIESSHVQVGLFLVDLDRCAKEKDNSNVRHFVVHGRPLPTEEWLVTPPVGVFVRNGVVTGVFTDAEQLRSHLLGNSAVITD